MSRRFILGWSLGATAIAACGVLLIYGAHVRYMSDYGSFIGQMSSAADYVRRCSSPPIWIRGLFRWCARPLAAAYCFTYVAEEAGGLLLLAYVMQHLPIEKQLRRGVSIAMALFSLSSRFGVNYTFFRCAGASLRWQRRCCWWGSWSRLESLRRSGADSEVACWDTRCCALRREFRWWLCGNEIYIALASTSSRHDFSIETQRRTNIAEMNGSLWDLLPTIAHSRRVLN